MNKSWRQHPTRHQLYGHLPPITKTIQVRRTRYAGPCWKSSNELIRDVLLWTPTYGREKAGQRARTYIQRLCEDTGCSPEDLPEAMNDREKWREMIRYIRASGTTWWWCYICIYIEVIEFDCKLNHYIYVGIIILRKISTFYPTPVYNLYTIVVYWPSTRPYMPFQSDAPEGSDIFRWQLWKEIA